MSCLAARSCLWENTNANFGDPILCVVPHPNDRHVVNLTNGYNVNDQVSSFRLTGSAVASSCPQGVPIAY